MAPRERAADRMGENDSGPERQPFPPPCHASYYAERMQTAPVPGHDEAAGAGSLHLFAAGRR